VTDFDEVAAQLYGAPPEEFTAARTEAVKAARAAGDRDLAREIGALRRPTVGAWLVNLLAHRRPDLIGDLLALGTAMRTAQRNLRGDELRELSVRRKAMVTSLAREARALAVAEGRGVRDTLPLPEVETTLVAALADDEVAEQVRLGRLVKTVEYAGFGEAPRPQLRLLQGGAGAPAAEPKAAGRPTKDGDKADRAAKQEAERAAKDEADRAAREEARQRAAAEKAAEKAAERERAAEQRRRRQVAHRELLAARTALAEAEVVRTAAERAVRDAKRRVEKAVAAVDAANAANAEP
jgi:hypothetical protein